MVMVQIPDAPWIRAAERYGTDYVDSWYGFTSYDDESEDEETDD